MKIPNLNLNKKGNNMKKLLIASSLLLVSSVSFAAKDAGCGLGAMVWEGKEGIVPNVLAATTNGSFGNQTFGMSTGTLGCNNSAAKGVMAMQQYLDSNLDKVAFNMSRGEGEYLQGLATVMGVTAADRSAFFAASKQNFDRIFPSEKTTRTDVINTLNSVLKEHQTLAKYAS